MATESKLAPCARCAAAQRTCCQRAEIVLTEDDVRRIGAATGRDDFWEHRAPADPAYLEADDADPNWLGYTVDEAGRRRALVREPAGDCTFLGEAGCVLDLETRPLVCRIYPYAYTESGLTGVDDDYCPRALLAPRGESMADVLEISPTAAETWRATLYAELRRGTP